MEKAKTLASLKKEAEATKKLLVEIEKKQWTDGELTSSPKNQFFNLVEWAQFKKEGVQLGFYVNKFHYTLDGVDLSYTNPNKKTGFDKNGKLKQLKATK